MTIKIPVLAIIQARAGSLRLPGKIFEFIGKKTVLGWVVERLKNSQLVDKIIIATSTNPLDDKTELFSKSVNLPVFRGSEEDVLCRFAETLKAYPAKNIVRATGDNPLLDTATLDIMIKAHADQKTDYTSLSGTAPLGSATEVISALALIKAQSGASAQNLREHVTPFIHSQPETFKLVKVTPPPYLLGRTERFTVDTEDDLKFMRAVYKALDRKKLTFNAQNALDLLEKQPELANINRHVRQKGWGNQ